MESEEWDMLIIFVVRACPLATRHSPLATVPFALFERIDWLSKS